MRFDVYCDESRPDVIHSKSPNGSYLVIGSLWLPTTKREHLKLAIHALRDAHKIGGEFKWGKVSPSKEAFYNALIELFFSYGDNLRFRCIAVQREQVDFINYHQGDHELGFYKFYYQLLHHWILDFNEYRVICDHKLNRDRSRLQVLCNCLSNANLSSEILGVQAIRSEESILLQFADVLTSATAARLNGSISGRTAKSRIVDLLENKIKRRLGPTSKSEQKFNVFKIQLGGGW
ncbi:MAG: DUF3800 domain-containing protein [Opitutales bacterium]|nr:DUF3800 domain-containing protein [Opitutales bacterium]